MQEVRYLSVTELARTLNTALESEFPQVFFEGEIAQITKATSGHLYFVVKDAESQLSAVMWQGVAKGLDFKPEAGAQVLCSGRPNLYSKSGRFQIVVARMLLSGEGDLRRKFLLLKEKLEREGFFSVERKRPLPFLPQAVGVVTSKTGAVIHDIMVKIRERFPSLKVYLVDARVQGEGAAGEIAAGIELLSTSNLVDVIIVARGGGSLEDLWAFNEEAVVKAIFAASVPVVSGVGHEVDVSLSDLAADVRAPTPTAAAELVVPKRNDLLEKLSDFESRLRDLDYWFEPRVQAFDELEHRLQRSLQVLLQEEQLRLEAVKAKLEALQPFKLLNLLRSKLELYSGRLLNRTQILLTAANQSLKHQEQRLAQAVRSQVQQSGLVLQRLQSTLETLSHRSVLKRGYALVEKDNQIVRTVDEVRINDLVKVILGTGSLRALVSEKLKEK